MTLKSGSHLPAMVPAMVPAIVTTVLTATGRQAALCLRRYRKSLSELNFPQCIAQCILQESASAALRLCGTADTLQETENQAWVYSVTLSSMQQCCWCSGTDALGVSIGFTYCNACAATATSDTTALSAFTPPFEAPTIFCVSSCRLMLSHILNYF